MLGQLSRMGRAAFDTRGYSILRTTAVQAYFRCVYLHLKKHLSPKQTCSQHVNQAAPPRAVASCPCTDPASHPGTCSPQPLVTPGSRLVRRGGPFSGACLPPFCISVCRVTVSVVLWALRSQSQPFTFSPQFSRKRRTQASCRVLMTHTLFFLLLSSELGTAYVSATTGAVATALGLNALTKVPGFSFLQ